MDGTYKFETVHSCTYLGSEVNCKNDVKMKNTFSLEEDISTHLKSYLISRKTRIALCTILVSSLATFSSETWTLTKKER
jgi:hypothetical protein